VVFAVGLTVSRFGAAPPDEKLGDLVFRWGRRRSLQPTT